jgi:hypothetical protein
MKLIPLDEAKFRDVVMLEIRPMIVDGSVDVYAVDVLQGLHVSLFRLSRKGIMLHPRIPEKLGFELSEAGHLKVTYNT